MLVIQEERYCFHGYHSGNKRSVINLADVKSLNVLIGNVYETTNKVVLQAQLGSRPTRMGPSALLNGRPVSEGNRTIKAGYTLSVLVIGDAGGWFRYTFKFFAPFQGWGIEIDPLFLGARNNSPEVLRELIDTSADLSAERDEPVWLKIQFESGFPARFFTVTSGTKYNSEIAHQTWWEYIEDMQPGHKHVDHDCDVTVNCIS